MRTDVEGRRLPEVTFTVTGTKVGEFLTALGINSDPRHEPADGDEVPPGFLMYVTSYGADPVHDILEMDFRRAVYGGAQIDYHQAVHVGDELDLTLEIEALTSRESRSGSLQIATVLCEYRRAGELVATERSSVVERST